MDLKSILAELHKERDSLETAISELENLGQTVTPKPRLSVANSVNGARNGQAGAAPANDPNEMPPVI